MSSYQIPEIGQTSDNSFLSVTCSVTTTASINHATPDRWELPAEDRGGESGFGHQWDQQWGMNSHNNGYYDQGVQEKTYFPYRGYQFGNQAANDSCRDINQSGGGINQQCHNNNNQFLDIDTTSGGTWVDGYPPYDNTGENMQCLEARTDHGSYLWIGQGESAQREADNDNSQRTTHVSNHDTQDMAYFHPVAPTLQTVSCPNVSIDPHCHEYGQLGGTGCQGLQHIENNSSMMDMNQPTRLQSCSLEPGVPDTNGDISSSGWTHIDGQFSEQYSDDTPDGDMFTARQAMEPNNSYYNSNSSTQGQNKTRIFSNENISKGFNREDKPNGHKKEIESPYSHDPPSPVENSRKRLLALSTQRLPPELQEPLDSPGEDFLEGNVPESPNTGGDDSVIDRTSANSTQKLTETKSVVDVDHMISSGVMVAGYKPRNIIRKRAKSAVPKTSKDPWYWEKRRKNNESARRSRETRKEKEKQFYKRALELEYENLFLRERVGFLETKLSCVSNSRQNMC